MSVCVCVWLTRLDALPAIQSIHGVKICVCVCVCTQQYMTHGPCMRACVEGVCVCAGQSFLKQLSGPLDMTNEGPSILYTASCIHMYRHHHTHTYTHTHTHTPNTRPKGAAGPYMRWVTDRPRGQFLRRRVVPNSFLTRFLLCSESKDDWQGVGDDWKRNNNRLQDSCPLLVPRTAVAGIEQVGHSCFGNITSAL